MTGPLPVAANPLATEAQRLVEDRALRLLARPELQRARASVRTLWHNATAWPSRDQADRFEAMIDEYMFHHAMRAANGDPADPHAARFMAPPHHWLGRDVPGSRWAGDSPDFIYRTIPIAHGGRYEIHGRRTCAEAPTVNWSLMSDNTAAPATLALLDSLDMTFEADGSFLITVDERPAAGRANHIQTRPGAEFLMVRDALGDWNGQSANALEVRRLDAASPRSEDAMAAHCAKIALDGVYYTFYITHTGYAQAPNALRPPMSAGAFGGMATQWGTKGNIWLEPDEAMIVRSNAAGAGFRNLVLTDAFHLSIEYWKRTSSLNMHQMAADEDGDFTFVIAHRDPGVHNWLDTGGLRRTQFGQRWQAFARGVDNPDPWMTARLVKFGDLDRELPQRARRIDPVGRHNQLTARESGVMRRFAG